MTSRALGASLAVVTFLAGPALGQAPKPAARQRSTGIRAETASNAVITAALVNTATSYDTQP